MGAKVLIASTSEVYGDPEVHPQPESYWGHVNPIGPRACYDEGKRVAEALAYAYKKQSGVEVIVWISYSEDEENNEFIILADSCRPHLQHVWPANAHERRPSCV